MADWYYEVEDHLKMGYKTKGSLFKQQSDFQLVEIIDTEAYGRMMLIDDLVMCTEKDEFVYHELIAHIPALTHPDPKQVVVIGGGDGGTVRELLRHPSIEKIVLCEIDAVVVQAAKDYLPSLSCGLSDPRVEVFIGDGLKYMAEHAPSSLDIVIVDSTDPISCGEPLFSEAFYRSVAAALRPDGVMACQSESPWHSKEMLHRIAKNIRGGFDNLHHYIGNIPTYPRGLWSFTIAGKSQLSLPQAGNERFAAIADDMQYLHDGMLEAVFQLPVFYKKKLSL